MCYTPVVVGGKRCCHIVVYTSLFLLCLPRSYRLTFLTIDKIIYTQGCGVWGWREGRDNFIWWHVFVVVGGEMCCHIAVYPSLHFYAFLRPIDLITVFLQPSESYTRKGAVCGGGQW